MKEVLVAVLLIAAMHTVVKARENWTRCSHRVTQPAVLDSLMRDFDKFLDSMSAPHSFLWR